MSRMAVETHLRKWKGENAKGKHGRPNHILELIRTRKFDQEALAWLLKQVKENYPLKENDVYNP